jgi:hypothetical protein
VLPACAASRQASEEAHYRSGPKCLSIN